jgi:hypothetical protein
MAFNSLYMKLDILPANSLHYEHLLNVADDEMQSSGDTRDRQYELECNIKTKNSATLIRRFKR